MRTLASGFVVILGLLAAQETPRPIEVQIPIDPTREIPLAEVIDRLADASGVSVPHPPGIVRLPTAGIGGALTRRMLAESLGPGVSLTFQDRALVVAINPESLAPENRPQWQARLKQLADRAEREAQRRMHYGMHALKSYRPNDPGRPTVCLVHGVNSSSGGFVHMFAPLEEAGYGIVVYDYPFNRDLDETCAQFRRDWLEFRRAAGETRPWALVGHSMGTLVARSYVEDPRGDGRDVATLILIAPVNQGASLAKVQTLYQMMNGIQGAQRTEGVRPAGAPGRRPRQVGRGPPSRQRLLDRPEPPPEAGGGPLSHPGRRRRDPLPGRAEEGRGAGRCPEGARRNARGPGGPPGGGR